MLIVMSLVLLGLSELLFGAYATLALLNHPEIASVAVRRLLGGLFALVLVVALVALFLPAWRWGAQAAFALAVLLFLIAWAQVEPARDREWMPDVARTARATVIDTTITFHSVRNFDYRSPTEFDEAWDDRSYRLDLLQGVDLFTSHWKGPRIAHVLVSFDFGVDGRIAISIEVRRELGEAFSSLLGLFRHFELAFVVADERDLVRLRTNHRKRPEQVYRYRLTGTPEMARHFLLSFARRINAAAERPEFYNTLTTNCTNTMWELSEMNPGRVPFSWKLLISGYAAEYLYDQGRLDSSVPFAELTRQGHVNARAQAADRAPDFSERIRAPLPSSGAFTESPAGSHRRGSMSSSAKAYNE